MTTKPLIKRGITGATAAMALIGAASVNAEPSIHYARAPRKLPAPMTYGRAYPEASRTIVYDRPQAYGGYARTYVQPSCNTQQVVYEPTPTVATRVYTEPAYVTPTRVVRVTTPTRYYRTPSYRYYGHYRHGYPHHRAYRGYGYVSRHRHHGYGHRYSRGYGRHYYGHRYRGYRHGHHRSWGFGISAGRHGGGFSFHLGR